jgi:hypothetical protein
MRESHQDVHGMLTGLMTEGRVPAGVSSIAVGLMSCGNEGGSEVTGSIKPESSQTVPWPEC